MTGLYIHLPFCASKCAYCDFYSLPGKRKLIKPYIEALFTEARQHQGMAFQTLFLGGGTPSLLGAENLTRLMKGLKDIVDLSGLVEATIEVNPESASASLLKAAFHSGINRLSIGVQSLTDAELSSVNRIHNSVQANEALNRAWSTGFQNISGDVIIGLPGQNWESLGMTLATMLHLGFRHMSVYCLALEHGTPLALKPPANLPSDDEQAELYQEAVSFLEGRGLVHYEISNFALPGYVCRHNLIYWRGGEYLGLGPSAASHLAGKRYKNRADLEAYIANPTGLVEEVEVLNPQEKSAEEAILRLRLLAEGMNIEELAAKFGADNIEGLKKRLNNLVIENLLIRDGSNYRLVPSQALTSNPIFARVLGD
jgi:oxygen-independent coproporphyrinogen III oxidase